MAGSVTTTGGFTVLELLIALCVAGIMSAIAVPLYGAIVEYADGDNDEPVGEEF